MLTKVRLPRIRAPWLPGIYLAVGILAGCLLGPSLYRLLLHDLTLESITAVATVALAVATVYLGIETRRLGAESVRTEYQLERQHQQTMTPLLKLSALPTISVLIETDRTSIGLDASLENRGSGPAFDVQYELESPNGQILYVGTAEPLGVLEKTLIRINRFTVAGAFINAEDWKFRIRYVNLFGATAMTVYRGTNHTNPYFLRPPIVLNTPEGIKIVPVVEEV